MLWKRIVDARPHHFNNQSFPSLIKSDMPALTTIACLTRTYAIIFGSYKYELTRAQARINSKLLGFSTENQVPLI